MKRKEKEAETTKKRKKTSHESSPIKKVRTNPKEKIVKKNQYEIAIENLNISVTNQVVGREIEIQKLYSFCKNKIKNKSSGNFYINGKPGIG